MLYTLPNSALVRWTYLKKLSACADLRASLSAVNYILTCASPYEAELSGA